jgi:hypothetical protein
LRNIVVFFLPGKIIIENRCKDQLKSFHLFEVGVRMGSFKVVISGLVGLLLVVLVIVGLKATAQNKSTKQAPSLSAQAAADGGLVRLSAPAKPAPEATSRNAGSAAFEPAALQNAQFQGGLDWGFGGKRQHGWYLYTPLIAKLIDTNADAAASEFAMRVSLWQKVNGLQPSGTLDGDTWSRMVSTFQSQRKYDPSRPASSQMITIPVLDCYDSSRPEELRKADAETFLAYRRMVAAASADPILGLQVSGDGQLAPSEKLLRIVSAYRSQEYQNQLRKQSPKSGSAGLATHSPHSTGRALDLYVGGEPVNTKDENRALQTQGAVYRWLVKNAGRFGFQPYFYEPWHWEYVGK